MTTPSDPRDDDSVGQAQESASTLPPRRPGKVVIAVLVVAVALAAAFGFRDRLASLVGGGGGDRTVTTVGDLTIEAWFDSGAPSQTGNVVSLAVRDAADAPATGAGVTVEYFMPAMGAMPEMKGRGEVTEQGPGEYDARFDLPMGGSWELRVAVAHGGRRAELRYAFRVGAPGLDLRSRSGGAERVAKHTFDDAALTLLRTAWDAYERARSSLAADEFSRIDADATEVAELFASAPTGLLPKHVRAVFEQAKSSADALASAEGPDAVRKRFGDLSEALMALAAIDPRLREGWHVFHCPMAQGFQKWFQRPEEIANPYMGKAMLRCGTPTKWSTEDRGAAAKPQAASADPNEVAYYTCAMHPSVKQAENTSCPICSMSLTPVTTAELETGLLLVDSVRRQKIGVRTQEVRRGTLRREIRAVGEVTYDETALTHVTTRISGWIEHLHVDQTGVQVERGAPLFDLYSPELYAAETDLLQAVRGADGTDADTSPLLASARKRLVLLGLTPGQVDAIEKRGSASETESILAPASGHVIVKNAIEGDHVMPGKLLYRIAALDPIWVEAQVYESDIPRVEIGQKALVTFPYLPGEEFEGEVTFVMPFLSQRTRTAKVRVVVPNEKLRLKPEMFANVQLVEELPDRLLLPVSAVVYTGRRRLVFVDLGEGRLQPKEVVVGVKGRDDYEVLSGLAAGDVVVTSGNFLIASESRIRSAELYWGASDEAR